jgi:ligand-binding sensor domain-containing protein/DNA-binding CsgD family transcriptional regulator
LICVIKYQPLNFTVILVMKVLAKISHVFITLICVTCIGVPALNSQIWQIGIPEIQNFTKANYRGGTQTWDMAYGKNGLVFFANNDGMLTYDGHRWHMYHLPNKTIVRSLAYDHSCNIIYVGGQDELGYFEKDTNGEWIYTNIKMSIPIAYRNLEDVWDLSYINNNLVFRSLDRVYSYDGDTWTVIQTKKCTFLSVTKNEVLFNDISKGVFSLKNGVSTLVSGSETFNNKEVISSVRLDSLLFLFTQKDGFWLHQGKGWKQIKGETSQFLSNNRVHSACLMNDSTMAIGTYLRGVVIIDSKGQIIQHLDKKHGIQNNTISSILFTPNKQLWIGTYNGIDMLEYGSEFRNIHPDGNLGGSVYAVAKHDNRLYCGTENGLYAIDLSLGSKYSTARSFSLVKGSEGQVWGLDVVDNDLIMSHNEGAFVVKNNSVSKISSQAGAWKFVYNENEGYCIGGFYTGIYLFRKGATGWKEIGKITGLDESSRIIVKDDSHFWISHPYRGIFRLKVDATNLSAQVESFGMAHGLPSNYRNNVFNIDGQIFITSEKGLYTFQSKSKTFELLKVTQSALDVKQSYKVLANSGKQFWYASVNELGFIDFKDSLFGRDFAAKKYFNSDNFLLPGFEKIYPFGDYEALLPTSKGITHFKKTTDSLSPIDVYLAKINISLNSKNNSSFKTLSYDDANVPNTFNYLSNNFNFEFATSACKSTVQYRTYLEPIQTEFSEWQDITNKEFNNLSPGKYKLHVEARDFVGNFSQHLLYEFEIKPPWYKTMFAYFIYICGILGLLFFARLRLVKKYEKITTVLEEEINESQAMVMQLQNETLERDILFKNKELGLSTMHLVQKNETIQKLKQELDKIYKNTNDPSMKKEIKGLISILFADEKLENDWDVFAQNFDVVHNDFLNRLKAAHPELSVRDLKLCAYLKLNLSTKDIAPLLNISVRGVEISRYRLRKKLNLPNEANLADYMLTF